MYSGCWRDLRCHIRALACRETARPPSGGDFPVTAFGRPGLSLAATLLLGKLPSEKIPMPRHATNIGGARADLKKGHGP